MKYRSKKLYSVNCKTCKKQFDTLGKNINRGGGKYCSRKCNPVYQAKFTPAEKARRYNLKSKYGLSEQEYNELLIAQNFGCKICGSKQGNSKHENLFVDHSHKFGIVRGLLCGKCNSAISLLRDCPETIRAALFYVLTDGDITPNLEDKNEMTAEQLYEYWNEADAIALRSYWLGEGVFDQLMQ